MLAILEGEVSAVSRDYQINHAEKETKLLAKNELYHFPQRGCH